MIIIFMFEFSKFYKLIIETISKLKRCRTQICNCAIEYSNSNASKQYLKINIQIWWIILCISTRYYAHDWLSYSYHSLKKSPL